MCDVNLEMLQVHFEVSGFLARECQLLDDGKIEDWVNLFSQDGLYWIPSNAYDVNPQRHVCVIYANRARLEEYVVRARSGTFWAQDPSSRTSRVVGNIQVEKDGDGYAVESRFVITEIRRNRLRPMAGSYLHRLIREGGSLKIREKLVRLVNNDEPLDNLSFMV
jgi:benzoate/toluate 1,2-dioxygenase beta subunit